MNLQEPFINDNIPQFVSTAKAARMLGLSTTLIQTLVDKSELDGWKTSGGHRRISLKSIMDYRNNAQSAVTPSSHLRATPRVMVAIENQILLHKVKQSSAHWGFPVQLNFSNSVTEALLRLGTERPDLLVVEMGMPRTAQQKTITALENFNTKGRAVSMVLVTKENQLRKDTELHTKHIQLAPGPLTEIWLHAYLTGVVASCRS